MPLAVHAGNSVLDAVDGYILINDVEEGFGGQVLRTINDVSDDADRLTEEHITDTVLGNRIITYTYDNVGNRLTKDDNGVITTYDYDDNDRVLTEGGYTYGYDNNGNLLSKTGNGKQYDFTYNALNQLIHADINTGGGSSTVDYVYDHDGIRVGKTINGTNVIKYVVDKNRPYAQVLEEQWTNGSLNATTSYVYGDALLSRTTNGVTHFYHYDGLGSTRTLTNMIGVVSDTYQYDAYGILLDKTSSTINPYLYRGEQYEFELDVYYLRARYYQPGIGRFLTTDPVGGFVMGPMSLHRYLYGNCDPVNYLDPSGKVSLYEMLATTAVNDELVKGKASSQGSSKKQGTCGPDVTAALTLTLEAINQAFDGTTEKKGWTTAQKLNACLSLYYDIYTNPADSWDIKPLRDIGGGSLPSAIWKTAGVKDGEGGIKTIKVGGKPYRDCAFTVRYHGKCHNAGFLNFIMFGVANQKCSKFIATLPDWKHIQRNYELDNAKSTATNWKYFSRTGAGIKKFGKGLGDLRFDFSGFDYRGIEEVKAAVTAGYERPLTGCQLKTSEHEHCIIENDQNVVPPYVMGWSWKPVKK